MEEEIDYSGFRKVDVRVGTIIDVQDFPEARKKSFKLQIDFGGELGIKRSSAQIAHLYKKELLVGRQVLCVVNFPRKQIANFFSECLTLGVDGCGGVVLILPERKVENGKRLY